MTSGFSLARTAKFSILEPTAEKAPHAAMNGTSAAAPTARSSSGVPKQPSAPSSGKKAQSKEKTKSANGGQSKASSADNGTTKGACPPEVPAKRGVDSYAAMLPNLSCSVSRVRALRDLRLSLDVVTLAEISPRRWIKSRTAFIRNEVVGVRSTRYPSEPYGVDKLDVHLTLEDSPLRPGRRFASTTSEGDRIINEW